MDIPALPGAPHAILERIARCPPEAPGAVLDVSFARLDHAQAAPGGGEADGDAQPRAATAEDRDIDIRSRHDGPRMRFGPRAKAPRGYPQPQADLAAGGHVNAPLQRVALAGAQAAPDPGIHLRGRRHGQPQAKRQGGQSGATRGIKRIRPRQQMRHRRANIGGHFGIPGFGARDGSGRMRAQGGGQIAPPRLGIGQHVAADIRQLHRLAEIGCGAVPARRDIEKRTDHEADRPGDAVTIAVQRRVIRDLRVAGILRHRLDEVPKGRKARVPPRKERPRLNGQGIAALRILQRAASRMSRAATSGPPRCRPDRRPSGTARKAGRCARGPVPPAAAPPGRNCARGVPSPLPGSLPSRPHRLWHQRIENLGRRHTPGSPAPGCVPAPTK